MKMTILLTISTLFLMSGCALTVPSPQNTNQRFGGLVTESGIVFDDMDTNEMPHYVSKVVPKTRRTVNSLNTIIPQRKKEIIMRGVMMPYESNGVMHDSSFSYIVVQEAGWNVSQSKKIRSKKVIGAINGI